jgi:membrane peptidoglycan carboxypeptidase
MSEHRRKQQQPGRGDTPAAGRSQQPPQGAGYPQQGAPGGYPPGGGSPQAGAPQRRTARPQGYGSGQASAPGAPATSAQPQMTRAEMRKAAQSKGRRGATAASGAQGGGRRGGRGGGGPTGPKPKRLIDYPRWGKSGVRRWLPSWRLVLSGFLICTAGLFGVVGVAYATLKTPNPQYDAVTQSNTYYWQDGSVMVQTGAQNRQILSSLATIPKDVQSDFLAAENSTFWTDSGIDPEGILRAVYDMAKGEETQSGSTITQQWIKNYYLTAAQTPTRKLDEILLAVKISKTAKKQQILLGYLNTCYFGRGAYGIEAAAKTYYGVDVSQLNASQGAFLASLVNGPSLYDPYGSDIEGDNAAQNKINATQRWTYVLKNMAKFNFMSATDSQAWLAKGFPMPKPYTVSDTNMGGQIGYMVTLAQNNLLRSGVSQAQLDQGGYQVYTTFSKKDENAMVASVNSTFAGQLDPKRLVTNTSDTTSPDYMKKYPVDKWLQEGAASVVPGNGAVNAIYGGSDFLKDFNDNADTPNVLVGSTFKAFVLAAAEKYGLQEPVTYNGVTIPAGTPLSLNSVFSGKNDLVIKQPNGQPWLDQNGKEWQQPNDDNESYGNINLKTAMDQSVNSVYVQLGMDVGMQNVKQAAIAAGLNPDPASAWADDNVPSFALGTSTPGPIRLATAYATFANDGIEYDPYEVDHYVYGGISKSLKTQPKVAFSPQVADTVNEALEGVVSSVGTGEHAMELGWPGGIAGKTGTTDSYKSALFVGYTKKASTAVLLFDQNPSTGTIEPLIGLAGQQQIYGADFPTQIWTDYMKAALSGVSPETLNTLSTYGSLLYGPDVTPSSTASASSSATSTPSSTASSHPSRTPSAPASNTASSTASSTPSAPPSCLVLCPSPSSSDTSSTGGPGDGGTTPSAPGWGNPRGGGGDG